MDTITSLVASGRIVDLIALLMAAELAALAIYQRATGNGPSLKMIAINSLAGLSLLLALRAALTGAGAEAIAAFLALSFAAHLLDLAARWRN